MNITWSRDADAVLGTHKLSDEYPMPKSPLSR
jgi:hypothetical protein